LPANAHLQQRQKELLDERRRVAQELHNEARKRMRRMDRARGLSDDDLLEILRSRAAAKAKASPEAKATGKAKAKGEPSA